MAARATAGGGLVETDVNLEWRPAVVLAQPGETIDFGLYAVSVDGITEESMSAINVVVLWDPGFMSFQGYVDNGPYEWLASGFPNDAALDDLNADIFDGDFLFEWLAQFFGGFAVATPEGLLIGTMRFRTENLTLGTEIDVPETYAQFSQSAIVSGDIPGLDIKREVPTARIRITSEPYPEGDSNDDGAVNLLDYGDFFECAENVGPFPFECRFFDYDVDLDVDMKDYGRFQVDFE
jgi:hypothetical protein